MTGLGHKRCSGTPIRWTNRKRFRRPNNCLPRCIKKCMVCNGIAQYLQIIGHVELRVSCRYVGKTQVHRSPACACVCLCTARDMHTRTHIHACTCIAHISIHGEAARTRVRAFVCTCVGGGDDGATSVCVCVCVRACVCYSRDGNAGLGALSAPTNP